MFRLRLIFLSDLTSNITHLLVNVISDLRSPLYGTIIVTTKIRARATKGYTTYRVLANLARLTIERVGPLRAIHIVRYGASLSGLIVGGGAISASFRASKQRSTSDDVRVYPSLRRVLSGLRVVGRAWPRAKTIGDLSVLIGSNLGRFQFANVLYRYIRVLQDDLCLLCRLTYLIAFQEYFRQTIILISVLFYDVL